MVWYIMFNVSMQSFTLKKSSTIHQIETKIIVSNIRKIITLQSNDNDISHQENNNNAIEW